MSSLPLSRASGISTTRTFHIDLSTNRMPILYNLMQQVRETETIFLGQF